MKDKNYFTLLFSKERVLLLIVTVVFIILLFSFLTGIPFYIIQADHFVLKILMATLLSSLLISILLIPLNYSIAKEKFNEFALSGFIKYQVVTIITIFIIIVIVFNKLI